MFEANSRILKTIWGRTISKKKFRKFEKKMLKKKLWKYIEKNLIYSILSNWHW